MEKKKTYLYIYVCMAALLFVGAAISLSVGSAEIGIIGSIKLALSGIPGIGQFMDISAYSTMQRYIILQVCLPRLLAQDFRQREACFRGFLKIRLLIRIF